MTVTLGEQQRYAPYIGLDFYTEEDAALFFGRDSERSLIIGNLRAARFTLLYAQSGVGKSSLLRAGVASRIREQAERSTSELGFARNIPVVFSSWRDDPATQLIDKVERAIAPFVTDGILELPRESLIQALAAAAAATGASLLIILDQFEEYILYSSREARTRRFVEELAACVRRADLPANFLIAVREDSYARLGDLFGGRIANLYGNYLHLEYLSRAAATDAIMKPIDHLNSLWPERTPIEVEPDLTDAVLDQVRTGQVAFEEGRGRVAGRDAPDRIETPYLQLVMTAVWERERSIGSNVLRRSTLAELGDAEQVVRAHLNRAMSHLSEDERDAAVEMFNYLVTPSGMKIAHSMSDIAGYAGRDSGQVAPLVEKLASGDQRILRYVPPPPGEEGGPRVEIFHDVLAPAVLGWRSAQVATRLEHEKQQAVHEASQERRRARLFRALAGVTTLLLIAAAVLALLAHAESKRAAKSHLAALSSQLGAQSLSDLGGGSLGSGALGRGVLLSLAAYRFGDSIDARTSLLRALVATDDMRAYFSVHTAAVTAIAYSPNGKLLASGSADASIVLQDASTGQTLRTIRDAGSQVQSVTFTTDSRLIAAGSADGTVRVWSATTGRRVLTLRTAPALGGVVSVAVNSAGLMAAGSGPNVYVWDLASGHLVRRLHRPGAVVDSVAFGPDGTTVAAGDQDGTVAVWRSNSGHPSAILGRSGGAQVDEITFSPRGRELASANATGKVTIWNYTTGRQLRTLRRSPAALESLAYSPNGRLLAAGGDDRLVTVWDLKTGRPVQVFSGHSEPVDSVAFDPSGTALASSGEDDLIIVWSLQSHTAQRVLGSRLGNVTGVAFSPHGDILASGSGTATGQGRIVVWSSAPGRRLFTLRGNGGPVLSVALNSDGILAAANVDHSVTLWNLRTRAPLRTLTGPTNYVYSVALSPNGRLVAGASADQTVTIWSTRTGRILHRLVGHTSFVYGVAFSPNGKMLASASADQTVILWNALTGRRLATLRGHTGPVESVAFSPNGRLLASASDDGTVIVWNAKSGQQIGDPLTGHRGHVLSVAFSPDSRRLVSGSADGTVVVWDLATHLGEPVMDHEGTVSGVAFSPNGSTVAASSLDGTVNLSAAPSKVSEPAIAQRLCRVVRRNLTRAEWHEFAPGEPYERICGASL